MNTENRINHRLIVYLFTPSWLSGVFCATTALLVTGATIVLLQFSGSNLKLLYDTYRESEASARALDSASASNVSTLHQLFSSAPLLVFWALIGLVVYLLATNMISALRKAGEVTHELEFVNGNRHRLIMNVLGRFVARCVVAAIWLAYILFFMHSVIPYVLTAATAGGLLTIDGAMGMFLSVIIMAAALHVHIVLLRLVLLKPRILSRALYVS